jgi:XTP/dITP diphosphohydrolase
MTNLLIATTNEGKKDEIARLLEGLNYQVIGLNGLPRMPPVVEETGATFAENALIKAAYYHKHSGMLTLADDSGLMVDALGGNPGVYSARYGGPGIESGNQIALLLEEMKDVPAAHRTARFACAIAIAGSSGGRQVSEVFEGFCEGTIAGEPRGQAGFGYDPIFIDAELGLTFAELSQDEKAARSHRGRALRMARNFLEMFQPE